MNTLVYVGIDDTDSIDSRGTNKLARALVEQVGDRYLCRMIVRHQLLIDPRVPCTCKNGCASILLEARSSHDRAWLIGELRRGMLADFIDGSDPGLCVTEDVSDAVVEWGLRCKRELVEKPWAYAIARHNGLHLEELGGTGGGVIGALAAVGLCKTQCDGRVVQWGEWPDDFGGLQPCEAITARGVEIVEAENGRQIATGSVDLGKRLRPNLRDGRVVLFVAAGPADNGGDWHALKWL